MLPVVIQSVLIALSGLASVGSITLVILLLLSDRGWRNGLGYALGYTGAYVLIGVGAVVLGYRAAEDGTGAPNRVLPVLWMLLGALLLWVALRNWRRPVAENPREPRIFSLVDKVTPLRALGFGAAISVVNVKNLALFLTAMSVVAISDLAIVDKLLIALLVALVFCLSVIVPVAIYVAVPKRAGAVLSSIRNFLTRHARPIGLWAPLVFGLVLVTKGISDLS